MRGGSEGGGGGGGRSNGGRLGGDGSGAGEGRGWLGGDDATNVTGGVNTVSFERLVMPALTRAACNVAAPGADSR